MRDPRALLVSTEKILAPYEVSRVETPDQLSLNPTCLICRVLGNLKISTWTGSAFTKTWGQIGNVKRDEHAHSSFYPVVSEERGASSMPGPSERLPERRSEILVEGARLKFVLNASGELEILGNRKGLRALGAICSGLSESEKDDHYHLDEQFWRTEPGSVPAIIYRIDEL